MCLGGLATFGCPVVNFAQVAAASGRFVFVLLRGGFDGLAAVVPYGDPVVSHRCAARFAFDESELVALNDTFGLAPGLAPLARVLGAGRARRACTRWRFRIARAATSTARRFSRPASTGRSGSSDGWLNRLLQVMSGRAVGHRDRVGHAAVADRPVRRADVVADAARRRRTMRTSSGCRRCIAPTRCCTDASRPRCSSRTSSARSRWRGGSARRGGITPLMQAAARILRQDGGPNIAAVEFSGWDTHANQGLAGGALDRLLGQLAEGLDGVPHRHGRRRGRTRRSS